MLAAEQKTGSLQDARAAWVCELHCQRTHCQGSMNGSYVVDMNTLTVMHSPCSNQAACCWELE